MISGIRPMTIQAPCINLVPCDNQRGEPGSDGPKTVDQSSFSPNGVPFFTSQCFTMPACEGKGEENPYRIERNQCMGITSKSDDQEAGKDAEDE